MTEQKVIAEHPHRQLKCSVCGAVTDKPLTQSEDDETTKGDHMLRKRRDVQAIGPDDFPGSDEGSHLTANEGAQTLRMSVAQQVKPTEGNGSVSPKAGPAAFFGTWPVDEADNAFLAKLDEMRKPPSLVDAARVAILERELAALRVDRDQWERVASALYAERSGLSERLRVLERRLMAVQHVLDGGNDSEGK